jgi:histidine triad (HIT) family protein
VIAQQSSATVLYEDDEIVAIKKLHAPHAPWKVDCLIIPKKHVVNMKTLDENDPVDATLFSKMGFVAQKLGKKLALPGDFQVVVHNGSQAAQSVFHMHMHFQSVSDWKK